MGVRGLWWCLYFHELGWHNRSYALQCMCRALVRTVVFFNRDTRYSCHWFGWDHGKSSEDTLIYRVKLLIICFLQIFVSAFFAYPNIVFYQELSEGIMTKENYPNEVHSCCCVPNKRKVSIREAIERRLGIFA